MAKTHTEILAKAMQLLGRRVVLHWLDNEEELCGTIGTLTSVYPQESASYLKDDYPKQVQIDNCYMLVDIAKVTRLVPMP